MKLTHEQRIWISINAQKEIENIKKIKVDLEIKLSKEVINAFINHINMLNDLIQKVEV